MNLVFHNPHAIWYKENVSCHFLDVKSLSKYDYLFDYCYQSGKKVTVLIDGSSRSPVFSGLLRVLDFPILDFYAWVLLNRMNPFRFTVRKKAAGLGPDNVIFSFLYGSFTYLNAEQTQERSAMVRDFKNSAALKIAHLTHYVYSIQTGSANALEAGIDMFVGEANISRNSHFFQRYFPWYQKDTLVLPFVPQSRFKCNASFSKRINKVLATGTNTHPISEKEFVDFFGQGYLQPVRKIIVDNQEKLEQYIDSLITNISTSEGSGEKIYKKGFASSFFSAVKRTYSYVTRDFYRALYLIMRFFFNLKRKPLKKERNYYKIDIVERYNSYKMFIVPEEVIGIPGIGFVEGMACGSAYVAISNPMYTDLGLIDKVHYIGYDGTLEDMVEKISYYQSHEEELEKIAVAGQRFVKENFNEALVIRNFIAQLEALSKTKKAI